MKRIFMGGANQQGGVLLSAVALLTVFSFFFLSQLEISRNEQETKRRLINFYQVEMMVLYTKTYRGSALAGRYSFNVGQVEFDVYQHMLYFEIQLTDGTHYKFREPLTELK